MSAALGDLGAPASALAIATLALATAPHTAKAPATAIDSFQSWLQILGALETLVPYGPHELPDEVP